MKIGGGNTHQTDPPLQIRLQIRLDGLGRHIPQFPRLDLLQQRARQRHRARDRDARLLLRLNLDAPHGAHGARHAREDGVGAHEVRAGGPGRGRVVEGAEEDVDGEGAVEGELLAEDVGGVLPVFVVGDFVGCVGRVTIVGVWHD